MSTADTWVARRPSTYDSLSLQTKNLSLGIHDMPHSLSVSLQQSSRSRHIQYEERRMIGDFSCGVEDCNFGDPTTRFTRDWGVAVFTGICDSHPLCLQIHGKCI